MKKSMKKTVALLFAICLALALVACGGKDMSASKYLGEWEMTSGRRSGITVSTAAIGTMTFNFKADGKCDFASNMQGKSESATVTWDETEKGVSVKEGSTTYDLVANGDALELTQDETILVFTRKQ